jgi:formamidopyrimidine-DNA glycosylase
VPELPEVEQVRRTLVAALLGATVNAVQLLRLDMVADANGVAFDRRRRRLKHALLNGSTITGLRRHGKQLALLGDRGPVLVIQLGMSGQFTFHAHGQRLARRDHVHCVWTIQRTEPAADCRFAVASKGRLVFRDPRRFGVLTTLDSPEALRNRWDALGPDALTMSADQLGARLFGSSRPIKAALLDQATLAGVGNIYADESLFLAGIDPRTPCGTLTPLAVDRLAAAIRLTLAQAIDGGGSTVRDYLNANGEPGRYAERLLAYGRGGKPCRRCGTVLVSLQVAQRTTVMCPTCQRDGTGSSDEEKNQFSSSTELGAAGLWINPEILHKALQDNSLH